VNGQTSSAIEAQENGLKYFDFGPEIMFPRKVCALFSLASSSEGVWDNSREGERLSTSRERRAIFCSVLDVVDMLDGSGDLCGWAGRQRAPVLEQLEQAGCARSHFTLLALHLAQARTLRRRVITGPSVLVAIAEFISQTMERIFKRAFVAR
jgi:hypothetical protein